MRRGRNPRNLWPILAVPLIGAIGWTLRQWLRRDRTDQSAIQNAQSMDFKDFDRKNSEKNDLPPSLENPRYAMEVKTTPDATTTKGHALIRKPENLATFLLLLLPFLVLPVAIIVLAFRQIPVQSQTFVPNGNVKQGQVYLQAWGCGACHTIPDVTGATGKVGPALDHLSDRSYIAGHLQNTPDNMIQWIMHPQQISPGVDMPDSNVPENVARDMAAYLYSLH